VRVLRLVLSALLPCTQVVGEIYDEDDDDERTEEQTAIFMDGDGEVYVSRTLT
jgi:hypothetical protein